MATVVDIKVNDFDKIDSKDGGRVLSVVQPLGTYRMFKVKINTGQVRHVAGYRLTKVPETVSLTSGLSSNPRSNIPDEVYNELLCDDFFDESNNELEFQPSAKMSKNKKRITYPANFKLKMIHFAEENGNKAAARQFGPPPPPTAAMTGLWRKHKDELVQIPRMKRAAQGKKARDPLKMVLTLQERIFIVENVFRDGGKYTKEVQESFQEKFGAERLPHRNCVSALLHKFKKTGSVQDKPKSGRPKVVTDTVLQNVTNKLQRSPRKSLRRLSQETRISLTSTHRAVHQLKFFPYKVHVVHELKPQDSEKRVLFCRWFENFILEKGENILNHTFFSDEAWFHLSGDPLKMVLTLQERIFIVENVFRDGGKYTKEVQESFQEKFGAERLPHRNCVSALLHKFKKTGSVQDKPKSGRPKVVTDTVLQNVTNKLQRSPRKSLRRLSQETRISLTSTHRAVHQLKFFPYKVHVVHELKPQDSEKHVLFCRWFENFILEKDNPRTTDELKQKITSVIQNIKPDELECVFQNTQRRARLCLQESKPASEGLYRSVLPNNLPIALTEPRHIEEVTESTSHEVIVIRVSEDIVDLQAFIGNTAKDLSCVPPKSAFRLG
ncbi:Hypothetical predicted protein [Octopus vulgaris]|uniref:DUF4817 domain-containing protein n=1 Tax=Octopus vulgaris TaxID=6645 RepID=A0AA36BCV6_OCTVU|nr:Hypothetical predicted protein [Octopus vulgaris]